MPLAAPIPATSSSAAPVLPANSRAHGKAASGQEFGELFRQKAETIEASARKNATGSAIAFVPAAPVAAPPARNTGEAANPAVLAQKAAGSTDSESATLSRAGDASTKPAAAGAAPFDLSPSGASPAQLQARFTDPPEAGATGKTHPVFEASPASLTPAGAEPAKTSKAGAKKGSPASPQTMHPPPKASQAGRQSEGGATPLLSGVPLPAEMSSVEKASATPGANPSAPAPQGAFADHPASPGQAAPPAVASQAASPMQSAQPLSTASASAGPGEDALHASQGADATSHASPESTSVEPASTAPRTSHALTAPAAPGALGATVASPSAIPAEAHPVSTETAAPPPIEQPSAANPAAGPAPAPVASLYDKIDQSASPVVLSSGAQHVSVGVRDPDLGWVEIKTQNVAGHVDATLVAASGQAHSSLAAHLPAMAEYLQQRDVRVGTLAVHQPLTQTNAGGGQGNGPGNGTGNGTGPGGGGAQSFSQSSSPHQGNASSYPAVSSESIRSPSGSSPGGIEDRSSSLHPVSYISVRA